MHKRLRASVRKVTGGTSHAITKLVKGELVAAAIPPCARWVEISAQEPGVFLFRFDERGRCIADTWHPTVEEAKRQAKFEYEILDGDWQEI